MTVLENALGGWPLTVAAIGGVVLFAIVRRLRGTPLVAEDLFVPPVVLAGIGLFKLHSDVGLSHVNGSGGLWLLASLAVGFAFGAARGTTVRLLSRDGALRQRCTVSTLLVWAASLVASAGFGLLAASAGVDSDLRPMTLSIGVGMLGETLTLGVRALSTGLPFSTDQRRQRRGSSWVDQLVASARTARPVTPPPEGRLQRSPTLRDGLTWLAGTRR